MAGGRGGGGGGGGRGAGGGRGNAAGPDPAAPQALPAGGIIEYYLGSVPANGVRIDIADSAGNAVAAFSSEGSVALTAGAPVAATPTNSDDPAIAAEMIGGGGGRGRGGAGGAAPRAPKNIGMNKFYWDFVNQVNTQPVPPGRYTVKLTAGSYTASHPYRLLIDPRLVADGVTAADLREQYNHNVRMRDMSAEVQRLQGRLQAAQTRLSSASGAAAADTLQKVRSILSRVLDQPVRYGKPGVATHIRYLAGMTSGADQKIGRDNIARYQVLRKELDGLIVETERALGK